MMVGVQLSDKIDELDLAERGESKGSDQSLNDDKRSTAFSLTEVPSSEQEANNYEEDFASVTGQTGSARRKTFSREWLYFAAGERQSSLVLDYWSAMSWKTYDDVVKLELQNREQGLKDYMEHRPNNEYGERKGKLMDQLTREVVNFLTVFSLANTVMNQHSPHAQYIQDYEAWACSNVTPNPFGPVLGVNNFRALGPRPSMIDALIHIMFKKVTFLYMRLAHRFRRHRVTAEQDTNGEEQPPRQFLITVRTYQILSHLFIITLALVFLVLPLMLIYLLHMTSSVAVLVTAIFCLSFCVGSFVFGSLNTDHKFLLLFAYTGVMATLLSNLHVNM
ncbi:hypothetical protein QBC38DRAFT_462884 [Podospora fimiseda]|uniref:DUF6594 domain-containing protein n=1 Tax=Podospora fimiseda TaxID=252190 RepID=A0AAN7C0B2_9PEZI|nr:hypothetical protein QBC38DRAFT_462884 [Podospora fimiseda]